MVLGWQLQEPASNVRVDVYTVDSPQIGHSQIGQVFRETFFCGDGFASIRRMLDLRTVNCSVLYKSHLWCGLQYGGECDTKGQRYVLPLWAILSSEPQELFSHPWILWGAPQLGFWL
jgi:hypothetical protein